jgi:hypothetical protein
MFLKESDSLVFSVSCTWLHFARGYAFVRFHMCFLVLFFSFYFAVSCMCVYLSFRKDKQINTHARNSKINREK